MQLGDIEVPGELWDELYDLENPELIMRGEPLSPINLESINRVHLKRRRAYVYFFARKFYRARSHPNWEVFGLNLGDLNDLADDHVALAQQIATETGFSFSGVEARPKYFGPGLVETYRLRKDRDYTLGELATLADELLQQYEDSFAIVTLWGNTGNTHDQGHAGSL